MSRIHPAVFLLGLLLFAGSSGAQAGIYKCQDSRGKTVFRDEPCREGQGGRFNLGATIEDTDPTGTSGDISGFYRVDDGSVEIQDALGLLQRSKSVITLYLIPIRYTSDDVAHFRESGDESLLQRKPGLDPEGLKPFPYLKLVLRFKKGAPLTRDNIEAAELALTGLQANAKPVVLKLDAAQALAGVSYLSVFEDITQGDINLEAEYETGIEQYQASWKLSIRAPLYYR